MDEGSIVRFDDAWYLHTYPDAAVAVANGTAGSAYAYFLTVGIDKGEQPNASQHITRADLPYAIVNNDPQALGNSALLTQQLGTYAGDGVSASEQALVNAINTARGGKAFALDSVLSAIAFRKAMDLVANSANGLASSVASPDGSGSAYTWSNGNALTQQFNGAFSAILGTGAASSAYDMLVVASPSISASGILAAFEAKTGGKSALIGTGFNTIGIGEYGGFWVVLLAHREGSYVPTAPGGDTLHSITEYGENGNDTLYAGTRAARLYGLDGNDLLFGARGNDDLIAGAGNDTLNLSLGGNDAASGGSGNDTCILGAALTAADRIDGGSGTDTVELNGDYSGGLVLGATTIVNVEKIDLAAGHSYDLTTNDATVAAGKTLTLDGSKLGASDSVAFDGSGETNGLFVLKGGAGDDTVRMGAAFTNQDRINGGGGSNSLYLDGDYSSGLTLGPSTIQNIQGITVESGHSYKLTTNDANVAAGQWLYVTADDLHASDAFTFDGSNETNGHIYVQGGAGKDVLTGGANDDQFRFDGSTFHATDTVNGGAGRDRLDLDGDYSSGITFRATTIKNIEYMVLNPGYDYSLTLNDGNVAAGQQFQVYAELDSGDSVNLDGSHETNGSFYFYSTAGFSSLKGGSGDDVFGLSSISGKGVFDGNGGADEFDMGARLSSADKINGGGGHDSINLDGDYSKGLVFGTTTVINVEQIDLSSGHTYNLTTNDATVASNATLTVDGSQLGSSDRLIFNGNAETDGHLRLIGGAGRDVLTGGGTNDVLTGGGGADTLVGSTKGGNTFRDTAAGLNRDAIRNFAASTDSIDITDMAFAKGATLSFAENAAHTQGTLTITEGKLSAAITLFGHYIAADFRATGDGHGGTDVVYVPPAAHSADIAVTHV